MSGPPRNLDTGGNGITRDVGNFFSTEGTEEYTYPQEQPPRYYTSGPKTGQLFDPFGEQQLKTPLHRASQAADVAKVKEILSAGATKAELDAQDHVGNACLHIVARCRPREYELTPKKIEICKLLLEAGASVTVRDQFGQTPLHLAAMASHPDGGCVELLCKAGARVDDPEPNYGNTALHWAALGGGVLVTQQLLEGEGGQAALRVANKKGETPKMVADLRPRTALDIGGILQAAAGL